MSDVCKSEGASSAFLSVLQDLPIINDAVTRGKDFYNTTKDCKCVAMAAGVASVAVGVASVGVQAAVSVLPLTVLGATTDGWEAIDQWACHKLCTVKTWAPIITKPTSEMIGDVKEKVLEVVAGSKITPQTLTGALTARADYTVSKLNEYGSGRAVVNVADGLVDKASILLDQYLPQYEGETTDPDFKDQGLVLKTLAVAVKAQLRAYRAAHVLVHADKDCIVFSTAHIVRCAGNYAKEWVSTNLDTDKPEVLSVTKITARLVVHITSHITLTLQALLTVTKILYTGTATEFTMAYLNYSQGIAMRTALVVAVSLQLVKVLFEETEKLSSGFWVRLASLIRPMSGAILKDAGKET